MDETMLSVKWFAERYEHAINYTSSSERAATGEASSSFARLMRRRGTFVRAEIVATTAVSLVRPEILGCIAEWYVGGEFALNTEVERARNLVAAARCTASAGLLLLGLEDSSLERVEVELWRKVLGKRSSGTHAHVVAPQVVSTTACVISCSYSVLNFKRSYMTRITLTLMVIYWQLVMINLHNKFKMPSFTNYVSHAHVSSAKNITEYINLEKITWAWEAMAHLK